MSIIDTLLTRDQCVLKRPQGGADAEGNPLTGYATVGTVRGTWGTPDAQERAEGGRPGQIVSATIAGTFQARVGDRLIGLRGHDWEIEDAHAVVTPHMRYLLRRLK